MNADMMMILYDVIVICYGLYMVYSAYQMRKTNQPPTLIVNQEDLVGARDIKAFCEAMFKPFVVFGMMAIIYGLIGFVNDTYFKTRTVTSVAILLFLILCFWFLREMKKNKTKYLK